jgi:hypothetical protein
MQGGQRYPVPTKRDATIGTGTGGASSIAAIRLRYGPICSSIRMAESYSPELPALLRNPTYGSAWRTVQKAVDYVATIGLRRKQLLSICRW